LWASIPQIVIMLLGVFIVHKKDAIMGKELAILYLISFIVIGVSGSGKYDFKKMIILKLQSKVLLKYLHETNSLLRLYFLNPLLE